MNATVHRCAVIVLAAFFVACERSAPPPTGTTGSLTQPTHASPTNFPPLSGPSRTFVFSSSLSSPVSDLTVTSVIVLYDNGAFDLRYPDVSLDYPGKYTSADSVATFAFLAQASTPDPGESTGTLTGDFLTVRYSALLQQAGFENAVYVRAR